MYFKNLAFPNNLWLWLSLVRHQLVFLFFWILSDAWYIKLVYSNYNNKKYMYLDYDNWLIIQSTGNLINAGIKTVESKSVPTIPHAIIAFCDGWKELNIEEEPLKSIMEEEYVNHHNFKPCIETFTHMVKSMSSALQSQGLIVNRVNAFMYLLPAGVISKLTNSTTQHLIANGFSSIRDNIEYYQFLATKMLRSPFWMSSVVAS